MLYHHDCPECQEAIRKYQKLARRLKSDPTTLSVALVDVPPYGQASTLTLLPDTPCAIGRLSNEKDWFVATPVLLRLLFAE